MIRLEIEDDHVKDGYVIKREGQLQYTDDNDNVSTLRGVFTEANFTNIEQPVEKAVIDLFNENENEGNISDTHFLGSLEKFNVIF